VVTADDVAKSVRNAQAAIRESGADRLAVILQGALVGADKFAEAGPARSPRRRSHQTLLLDEFCCWSSSRPRAERAFSTRERTRKISLFG